MKLRVSLTLLILTFINASALDAASVPMVLPTNPAVAPSDHQQFYFMVNFVPLPATWSIVPAGMGTITSAGLYTAPSSVASATTIHIKAASSSLGLSAETTVSLKATGGKHQAVISLSISPSTVSLTGGQSQQFQPSVTGTNTTGVTWSISPAIGTMNNGTYTAPATIQSQQTVKVTATSIADTSKTASSTITLAAGAGISITPSNVSLTASKSQQFAASVTGTSNTAVTWSLSNSPQDGTLTNGLYVAPAKLTIARTITVKATSVADPTKVASASIALVPVSAVGISLTPSNVSLTAGQSKQFAASVTGTSNSAVDWSLTPQDGTLTNGVYTAPSKLTTARTVTVIATSAADATKVASATVSLVPSAGISLSPSSASLTGGGSKQFTATVTGTSNTAVNWSFTPAVGTLSNGVYTAPATISSAQTITVTATSAADTSKTATASISLTPVGINVAPASISLGAGKSSQFTITVTGTTNTASTWSLTPAVGAFSNGLYTAPATVSSAQTVTLNCASAADPTKVAQAVISLTPTVTSSITVTPNQVSLAAGQSQQFVGTVSGSGGLGGSGQTIQWSINPAVGSITAAGLYQAPSSLSTQQAVTVTASSSSASTTANITLLPPSTAPSTSGTPPSSGAILLPLEVMAGDGTTQAASFSLPSSANLGGQLKLWAQIHGLKYQAEASVQINGGAWIPINDSTATLLGQADLYGGIGGGFGTLKLTLNLPSGSVHSGANTLTFRFNQSDGTTSGFRVLNLNILDASGTQLIPQSSFAWDNPATWQAPLNNSTDIQAGQNLWRNANLTAPGMGSIRAKCASCHPQDGRDLKYFNYSNLSIRVRSQFHGLTAQQGDQIASYIRSLNAPAPSYARPWNPPYQPGPGRDSTPVSEWAAGAGLDAVLDKDADMLPYVIPGGSTAKWAGNSYLNAREIPVNYQLLDWNRWLPTIHPLDAWGDSFTSSGWYQLYLKLRTQLVPNDPAAYVNVAGFLRGDMHAWLDYSADFGASVKTNPNWNDPVYVAKAYSISLWSVVKMWELHQEYGLEGMSRAVFGPQAADRAWNSNALFYTGPGVTSIPRPSPGIGNGRYWTHVYHSFMWYQLQLLLNDGNGTSASTWPIDWPYSLGYPGQDWTWDPTNRVAHIGSAAMMALWRVKALQNENDSTTNATNPGGMAGFPAISSTWSEVSTSQKLQILNAYTAAWFGKYGHMTHAQLSAGPLALPASNDPHQSNLGSETALMLARLRYQGVDITLLNQIAAWAATVWPGYNWTGALNGPCSPANFGEVFCTVP